MSGDFGILVGTEQGQVVLICPSEPGFAEQYSLSPQQARFIANALIQKAEEAERKPS